jgi:hypothetical protein
MRIRTIKPEFWTNEKLCSLPEITHLFAAAILNYADDEGYFNANPGLIKGALFPIRDTSSSIPVMLRELSEIGYLKVGETEDGRKYGLIVNFSRHQAINKKKKSKIKDLEVSWYATVPIPDEHGTDTTGNRDQGTGIREQGSGIRDLAAHECDPKSKRITKRKNKLPDTWKANETHSRIAEELNLDLGSQEIAFRDYEAAHQRRMVDWDAAFRTWLRKAAEFSITNTKRQHRENTHRDLDAWARRKEQEIRDSGRNIEEFEMGFGLLPGEIPKDRNDA